MGMNVIMSEGNEGKKKKQDEEEEKKENITNKFDKVY